MPSFILLLIRRARPLPRRLLLSLVISKQDGLPRGDIQQRDWRFLKCHVHRMSGVNFLSNRLHQSDSVRLRVNLPHFGSPRTTWIVYSFSFSQRFCATLRYSLSK